MKRFEISFGLLKIPTDFVMTVAAFLLAYKLRLITEPISGISKPIDPSTLPTQYQYLLFTLKSSALLIAIFALGKMYNLKTTNKLSSEIQKATTLCGIWIMVIITYFFFTRSFPFSRLAIIYSWTLTLLFIIAGRSIIRLLQRAFLKIGIGQRRLLFIGNNNITLEINKVLSQNPTFKILGVIGEKNGEGTARARTSEQSGSASCERSELTKKSPLKLLGGMTQLEYILKHQKIDEIIQVKSDFSEKQDEEILEFCELNQIDYRFIPDLLDVRRSNVTIQTIANIPIISLKPTPLDGWGKVLKRIMDIISATLGLIILSPIFLIIAIAIKIDSKGPILFSKLENGTAVKRVGEKGKPFKFHKFRSMFDKTHHLRYTELADQNMRKDGPLIKIADDPRITKIGKFLRKYSLDELPQLWNVLIGNMSLVGPRPHLPEEVANYKKHHFFVFNIKPGLTGLSQINGRSDLEFEKEIKLDRYYIENWSLWLDLKIIFKTLGASLRGYRE